MSSGKGNDRGFDRSYVVESNNIRINDTAFRLNDIAAGGFGIIVEGEHTFFIGQRLDRIELTSDQPSKILKGIVSHITKTQQHIICGVRFDYADHGEMDFVTRFMEDTVD